MSVVEDSMVGVGVPKLLDQIKDTNRTKLQTLPSMCLFHLCQEQHAHSWTLAVTYCKLYSQFNLGQETKERMGNALIQLQSHPIQNCRI